MLRSPVALLVVAAAALASQPASADCTCRGPGFIAHHGDVVCLKTAAGPHLARCGMALNNSSWIILKDSCPEASAAPPAAIAANLSTLPPGSLVLQ